MGEKALSLERESLEDLGCIADLYLYIFKLKSRRAIPFIHSGTLGFNSDSFAISVSVSSKLNID